MVFDYRVLGLTLRCTRPLPHLEPRPGPEGDDVLVDLGSAPSALLDDAGWVPYFESRYTDSRGEPVLRIARRGGEVFRFRFHGVECFVDGDGQRVWTRWQTPASLEDVALYLLGPVLGFVLRLRGIVPLHASAVVVDGVAVAFAGPSGAGKSTLAAAFARRGHGVLTDDTTVLKPVRDSFLVQVDHPLVRLWPEAAELLGNTAEALPRVTPGWEKRVLDLERHGLRAERSPQALAAVYELDVEPASRLEIQALHRQDAFLALVANTYANQSLSVRMRAREFDVLTRLLPKLTVRRVRQPAAGVEPDRLCELLTDDFRRHRRRPVAGRQAG